MQSIIIMRATSYKSCINKVYDLVGQPSYFQKSNFCKERKYDAKVKTVCQSNS